MSYLGYINGFEEDEEFTWTTKEGQKLRLDQIGDRHLVNIINLLKRKQLRALNGGYSGMCFLQGEMALDAAESAIDLEQQEYDDLIAFLSSEARTRGLNI